MQRRQEEKEDVHAYLVGEPTVETPLIVRGEEELFAHGHLLLGAAAGKESARDRRLIGVLPVRPVATRA